MALKASRRKALPKRAFGLPSQRKYPLDTVARAKNAKGRATTAAKKGHITAAQKRTIVRKANGVIKRGKGIK